MQAVEAASDVLFKSEVDPEETTPEQRRADAVALLAERALAAGFGDDAWGTRVHRYQVLLHVEPDTLRADRPSGRSELDGVRVCKETARRLTCDAGIAVVAGACGDSARVPAVGGLHSTGLVSGPPAPRAIRGRPRLGWSGPEQDTHRSPGTHDGHVEHALRRQADNRRGGDPGDWHVATGIRLKRSNRPRTAGNCHLVPWVAFSPAPDPLGGPLGPVSQMDTPYRVNVGGTSHPHDPSGPAPRVARPGPGLRRSRLRQSVRGGAPHRALGGWRSHGATNLVLLWARHHHHVHEHGMSVCLDRTAAVVFFTAEDRALAGAPAPNAGPARRLKPAPESPAPYPGAARYSRDRDTPWSVEARAWEALDTG